MTGEYELHTVHHMGDEIKYKLYRKHVKNINIRIKRDCTVMVSAKLCVAVSDIDKLIIQKWDFIKSAIKKFEGTEQYVEPIYEYKTGEEIYLLGRKLCLVVEQRSENQINRRGEFLHINVKDTDNYKKKEQLVKSYMEEQCNIVFTGISERVCPLLRAYGVKMPVIKVRDMKTKWGICVPSKNTITLNKKLIETPVEAIEYVILHEFCHFVHLDHSRKFYSLVEVFMPDWKERKAMLNIKAPTES